MFVCLNENLAGSLNILGKNQDTLTYTYIHRHCIVRETCEVTLHLTRISTVNSFFMSLAPPPSFTVARLLIKFSHVTLILNIDI